MQFDELILYLSAEKLNLLFSEIFQLSTLIDINLLDYIQLIEIIIREVARESICSVHFTSEEARHLLQIINSCRTCKEIIEKNGMLTII